MPRRGPAARPVSRVVMAGLRHYRQAAGLTLERAAQKSGYSLRAVHSWELGIYAPTMFSIGVLAEVYGVSADAILNHYPHRTFTATRVGPLVAHDGDEYPREVERVVGAPHLGRWEMEAAG